MREWILDPKWWILKTVPVSIFSNGILSFYSLVYYIKTFMGAGGGAAKDCMRGTPSIYREWIVLECQIV